jgi:hypothetical protein
MSKESKGKNLVCYCQEVEETRENAPEPEASTSHAQPRTSRNCRPGIKTRNPFFNYCRHIRETNCGLSAVDVVKRAAQEWKSMSPEQKNEYRSNCTGGRKTRNPFLNYVREKRGEVCGPSQTEIVRAAAQEWRGMSVNEKAKYQGDAKKVPRRKGLKRRQNRQGRSQQKRK